MKREFAVLSGFAPGAMVFSDDGPLPLEWLGEGDRVLTQSGSFERVLWVERTRLSMRDLCDFPELAPVHIAKGTLDDVVPDRDITVSPSQLLYFRRDPVRAGGDGVLIPANVVGTRIDPFDRPEDETVSYVSVLLPDHHLMNVDGVWAGSLFLADLAADLGADDPILEGLSGEVMEPAAPILDRREALQFLAARGTGLDIKSA